MKPSERWQEVKEILHSALEVSPCERASFLDKKCGDDFGLRREIESLIAAHDSAGGLFESPAFEVLAETISYAKDVLIGKTLGHYEILKKLGAGGMGEVYLARDSILGRKVALKLLTEYFTRDNERVRRFQQEARAASALNHPNILTIHEIRQVDSVHYIATEFIEGETLRDRMSHGPLAIGEALDVAIDVTSALTTAHAAGIIHRDIKPENIMLRSDRIAKVLDFGLAKLTEKPVTDSERSTIVLTDEGVIMGTVQYMSPEQARALKVDERTDIWSLGAVLYEMLCGRPAFEAPTTGDVIVSILERDPPPLARFSGNIPTELDWIVTKTLRKDREERYQTAKELHSDLRGLRQQIESKSESRGTSSQQIEDPSRLPTVVDQNPSRTAEQLATHPTSSAEYLVSEIKHHKFAALLLVIALVTALAGYGYYRWAKSATIDSMAVLPFISSTTDTDPDAEYLSDGITESLINSLSQLPDMRMIARTSAERYKGREVDPQKVASELGVRALLTGRVVRRGDSLIISAELIDARDSRRIWGEQYNRKVSDVLAVQQDIAREIAEKLRGRLSGDEQQRVTRNYTENIEAYQLYLRGRHHWNKRTEAGLRQAMKYFQQAIDLDPNYALAYSGLADCYSNLQGYTGSVPSEMLPRSRAAAIRALEIDPSLSEAHASLGLNYHQSWQWADSEREFKRAIELNPNYASAHQWYGLWLEVMGRFDEALAENRRAQEIDPLSPIINTNFARFNIVRGDVDAGIEGCRKVIELSPNFPQARVILALAYQKQGKYDEAIAELQKAVELSGRGNLALAALGFGYAVAGRRTEALEILKELEDRSAKGEAMGGRLSWIYAGLGDKDLAFASLEKEFHERGASLTNAILIYPYFDSVRDDPRYADWIRRMGLASDAAP